MYYKIQEIDKISIINIRNDSSMLVFPLTDDNPNTVAYLAWVAEGNTAEEWNPEEAE